MPSLELQQRTPGPTLFPRLGEKHTPATRFQIAGLAFKSFDAGRRECEIRSHSPKVDHGREVVPRSAIERDIDLYRANPLVTYCHNYSVPVGTTKDIGFDGQDRFGGIACFAEGYELADLAWCLVSQEIVRQASIGYDMLAPGQFVEAWDDGKPAYVHERIRIFEHGPVPLGMNEDTLVACKALGFDDPRILRAEREALQHQNALLARLAWAGR